MEKSGSGRRGVWGSGFEGGMTVERRRLGVGDGDGNGGVVLRGNVSWLDCAGTRMYVLDGLVLLV